MEAGGQPGNKNAAKAKRWQKALERALARLGGEFDKGLDIVADMVVAAAKKGDPVAWREIGDRIDGKAAQSIDVSGDLDVNHIARLPMVAETTEEWSKQHTPRLN